MRRHLRLTALVALVLISWAAMTCLAPAAEPQNAGPEPLEIRPDNTAILVAPGVDARRLQYYLIRGYVGPAEAEPFRPEIKADRAACPWFPVIQDGPKVQVPEGKNLLALGPTRFATQADKDRLATSVGVVRRQGNVLVLLGPQVVQRFLGKWAGIRLYAPGELWLTRPKKKQITIPGELDECYRCTLSWQSAGTGYRLEADKKAANPFGISEWEWMNGPTQLALHAPHNVANLFPPEKYGKTHPEIYEMRNGQRMVPMPRTQAWHPCFSAAALPDLAMDSIREEMRKNPSRAWISLFVMDVNMDCQCPACKASVKRYGDYSQLYHAFVIKIAERCKEEFPRLILTATPNYSSSRRPPQEGLRYPGNVAMKFLLKSFQFGKPGAMDRLKDRIQSFNDLGAQWLAHDWVFAGPNPRDWLRPYAVFLQWASQHGMIGTRIEWSNGEYWYLDGPKYWIMTQLYWDPYQDVNLLQKQYCDDLYGPASEVMYRLFQHFADKYTYAFDTITPADMPRQEPALYSPEDLQYQRGLLERAVALTRDDPRVQARLDVVMRYFTSHELFARACYEPARLQREFKGEGVNRAALDYYVNEKEDRIGEAVAFYESRRTVPPDVKDLEIRLGLLPVLISNYTGPKARIVQDIRTEAMRRMDPGVIRGSEGVRSYVALCKQILQDHLPKNALPERVKEFQWMLEQVLWVPRAATMPSIDGDLADEVWRQAAPLGEFRNRDNLTPSPHTTTGRIMRVGDRLLLGLVCRQVGDIWARTEKDIAVGTLIWRESGVEVYLGRTEQSDPATPFAQYIINALGAYRGFRDAADLRDAEVAVKRLAGENTYVIEASLPLKTTKYDYSQEKILSFNCTRNVFTQDSYFPAAMTGWHPVFFTGGVYHSRGLIFLE